MAVSTQSVSIGTAAGGDVPLAAAVADKRIIVTGFTIVNSVATAQGIQFKSGSTALTGVLGLPSSIGGSLSPHRRRPQRSSLRPSRRRSSSPPRRLRPSPAGARSGTSDARADPLPFNDPAPETS